MIKLLITDDDQFTRIFLRQVVQRSPEIEVIGEAENGQQAVEMTKTLKPDIITMDVMMPIMDGLEATAKIKAFSTTPIIMVSELTSKDSDATLKALELGAVDYLSKSSDRAQFDIPHVTKELANKVLFWGKKKSGITPQAPLLRPVNPVKPPELIVIGVSTGGPQALPQLFNAMGNINSPVIVAQNMPAIFTEPFVKQIQASTIIKVITAQSGMTLQPKTIYIIPGGQDCVVHKNSSGSLDLTVERIAKYERHPSINALFSSASTEANSAVGVVLTGTGHYGVEGAKNIQKKGWPVLVQDPKTCSTDGLPQATIQAGAATEILTLEKIGQRLAQWA